MDKPRLIFDGDCDFCRRCIHLCQHYTGDRVDYAPYQEVAIDFPEIPLQDFASSVHLVEPQGDHYTAAEAVFRVLAFNPNLSWMFWLYRHFPGFAGVSEWFYRCVSRHRGFFSGLTRVLWGNHWEPSTYLRTRRIFFIFLGAVYLAAFASLAVQIRGLYGSRGILPATELLQRVQEHSGRVRYLWLPTVFWLSSSDGALQLVCCFGILLSVFMMLGYFPVPVSFLSWALYLSLFNVGNVFLSFQWDILLLETGFLAIFLAPWALTLKRGAAQAPSRAVIWLFRWLLFRLMFTSGLVKWFSGDPSWKDGTALQYHYETQPLPNWISYYAHQAPPWFQRYSLDFMFFLELGVPWLIFAPRRLRKLGCLGMIFFQCLIMLTGNYGFFNWLTIALCVLLLDDFSWPSWLRGKATRPDRSKRQIRGWPCWIVAPFAAMLVLLSLVPTSRRLSERDWVPTWLDKIYQRTETLHLVNSYGLFAVMTTKRMEIALEGSEDGVVWLPYEFRWKPGPLNQAPRMTGPHMPRLDWQMWFAALSTYRHNPWLQHLQYQILEGSPEVLALLRNNPFPKHPPRYIRAMISEYRFTDRSTKAQTGDWWRQGEVYPYSPVLSLGDN